MWTILVVIIFSILFYSLNRRIKNIEEVKGNAYSQTFGINALHAVLANKMFGKLSKIKSAEEGKPFKNWPQTDRNEWHRKFPHKQKIIDKTYLGITYLASENAFYVKTKDIFGLVLSEFRKTSIYSSCLIGDESYFKAYLEFGLVDRIADYSGRRIRVISGYLTEGIGSLTKDYDSKEDSKNKKTQILFDFPLDRTNWTDEEFKSLGFEIERYEPSLELQTAGHKDIFGETEYYDTHVTYKKNEVEIHC